MNKKSRSPLAKHLLLLFVLAAGCNTDLYTKHLVSRNLDPGESITLTEGYLEIKHAQNRSASFGMLGNIDLSLRRPILIALQSTGCLLLAAFVFLRRRQAFAAILPFVLVLAGALGNAVDRIKLGYVVDFIHFHVRDHVSWPIFNIADILIVAGLIVLLLQMALLRGKTTAAAPG